MAEAIDFQQPRGRMTERVVEFTGMLRRAGISVAPEQVVTSIKAIELVGVGQRADVRSAMLSTLISCERDRATFVELFDAHFRFDASATGTQDCMSACNDESDPTSRSNRARDALNTKPLPHSPKSPREEALHVMTPSEQTRLRRAKFDSLSAEEYKLVEDLARKIGSQLPSLPSRRRSSPAAHGKPAGLHWPSIFENAARCDGEVLELVRARRQEQSLPLVVIVDVSGSMQLYSRMLLSFLHSATRGFSRRSVFVFGGDLTDLSSAFLKPDTDQMLRLCNELIKDYAGATRIGYSMASLRRNYGHRLVGRRSVVMLVSDGLEGGDVEQLEHEVKHLAKNSRQLLWLNPLLRFERYQPLARGARILAKHADRCVEVHNLERLELLSSSLVELLRAPGRTVRHA